MFIGWIDFIRNGQKWYLSCPGALFEGLVEAPPAARQAGGSF
jgi:hypothetical protein